MTVKYECPKCGRRFTEWGAEKLGFKCPQDEWSSKEHGDDVELVRVGSSDSGQTKRPSLKRSGAKKKAAAKKKPAKKQAVAEESSVEPPDEDEALVPDTDDIALDDDESDSPSDEELNLGEKEKGGEA